jgi:hypothetical protein
MNRGTTLPGTREQARHALLLLGAPAPARLVVATHRALFDGDLDTAALTALLRSERQAPAPLLCHGLTPELAPVHVALAAWPAAQRIVTARAARAARYLAVIRIAEFLALRPGAGRAPDRLLRALAAEVPGGAEAVDPAAAARDALAALGPDPQIEAAAARAARLAPRQQLFGVPRLPRPRGDDR